jgi:protein-tyrosine phosphatase
MQPTFRLATSSSTPPTRWSYWVIENRLLAGAFPGAPDPSEHRRKVDSLVTAGIRAVINLMETTETDHQGRYFAAYESIVTELAAPDPAECVRYPIPDVSVPKPKQMSAILNHIDQSMGAGRPVYVHCWGGVGRTGTVVGCWLLRHGLATHDDVLDTLSELRAQDIERGHRMSPETHEQQRFVRDWGEP